MHRTFAKRHLPPSYQASVHPCTLILNMITFDNVDGALREVINFVWDGQDPIPEAIAALEEAFPGSSCHRDFFNPDHVVGELVVDGKRYAFGTARTA